MELFANELSLHGQFIYLSEFETSLKQVLLCKKIANRHGIPLFCLRSIAERPVNEKQSFRQVVSKIPDINVKRTVMSWIDKHGPFWKEIQKHDPDEWFEYQEEVVTECSLGEVAFRYYHDESSAILGFNPSHFMTNPLIVVWRHSDTSAVPISIPNFWDCAELETYLKNIRPKPTSWAELLEQAKQDFPNLVFLDSLLDVLKREPFNLTIAEKVVERLTILNKLKNCFDEQGRRTAEGEEIVQVYFQGEKALFSDESETNKRKFEQELTFKTPDGEAIFCPEHGKISYHTFRIHYSAIRHDKPLYIAYIGYKITRD